jgi:uncharacterized protein YndB with AHSA1/START domain
MDLDAAELDAMDLDAVGLDAVGLDAVGLDAVGLDELDRDGLDDEAVTRTVELEASVERVWDAVCDPTGWLADSGWLDVRPGGEGRLTDDGVERDVVVDDVEEHSRLVYRWWRPEDGPAGASRVEITVLPTDGSTRLVIRESRPQVVAAAVRWEVRATCLWLRTMALPAVLSFALSAG